MLETSADCKMIERDQRGVVMASSAFSIIFWILINEFQMCIFPNIFLDKTIYCQDPKLLVMVIAHYFGCQECRLQTLSNFYHVCYRSGKNTVQPYCLHNFQLNLATKLSKCNYTAIYKHFAFTVFNNMLTMTNRHGPSFN